VYWYQYRYLTVQPATLVTAHCVCGVPYVHRTAPNQLPVPGTVRCGYRSLRWRCVPYGTPSYAGYNSLRSRCVPTVPTVHPATLVTAKLVTAKLTAFVVRVTSVAGCTVRYTQLRWLQLTAFAVRVTSVAGCTVRYTPATLAFDTHSLPLVAWKERKKHDSTMILMPMASISSSNHAGTPIYGS
jgi:hypothetical protein